MKINIATPAAGFLMVFNNNCKNAGPDKVILRTCREVSLEF